MNRYLVIMLVVATVFGYGCKDKTESEIQIITTEEMQELSQIEDVQLVDIRTPEERKKGYIANSQNIDYNSPTFDKEIEKLDKSKPVIVYCKSGNRSAKCAEKMKNAGFVKIYDLDGGIATWKYKGFEIKSKP